ncbi:hypothetical protein [Lapidilactobacillus wuchangensis]|uniref:hypothetical protein n=1 Tax=Lapidilactobacillus wuchangensis TaxID=2486001 RepID=UPI000F7B24FB|nr:hypothetical protein [Lapidilactobacillus wuchangensis]
MANKMQQKARQYSLTINRVVSETEKIQEELDPLFQKIQKAIKADTVADLTADEYHEIKTVFASRTADYQDLADELAAAVPPARLMGNQKFLAAAFQEFVDGCQAMTDSLQADQTVDQAAFSAAEAAQDVATDKISKYLQRISSLI